MCCVFIHIHVNREHFSCLIMLIEKKTIQGSFEKIREYIDQLYLWHFFCVFSIENVFFIENRYKALSRNSENKYIALIFCVLYRECVLY